MEKSRQIQPAAQPKRQRPAALMWERFLGNKPAVFGGVVLVLMLLACAAAPLLTPYDPSFAVPADRFLPPGDGHLFGTDSLGRDLWARVLYGGRYSIFIGLASAVGASVLGVIVGCFSGYFGGYVDKALLYISELFTTFPQMLLVLICVGLFGQSTANIILVFIFTGWSGIGRVVRNRILSLKEEPFVESCRAAGISNLSIMFRQLLPGTLGAVIVHTTLATSGYILAEAGLSFLGLGVPSSIPTWGNIINAAKRLDIIIGHPAVWLVPGIAISLFVLSVNFFGDGLRDVFDPTSRRR